METIYIYNGASRLTIPVTDSAERAHSLQQHNYVKLVWKSAENTPISANAYIEYEGQVFYALDDYFPTHKDGIYEYDIEFHAIEDTFNRPLFFRYVDILDQTTGETTSWKEIEWSLNGNLKTIADIVITCLNRAYNNAYFELPADSYTDTLLMSYSFSGNSIADALSTIAEQNETEWWLETTTEYVDGKCKYILHFDKCEIGTTIELNDHYTEDANGVWQSGGLKSVSQSGNTNIIPQKLYVYGSERNIIKKTVEEETEGGKMNVSYDKKLRLPSTFPNGTKEYTIESAGVTLSLNDDSSISIGGINNHFEQVKIFDEVYPKMDMEVTAVSVQNPNSENPIYWLKGDRLTSITDEAPVDGSINPGKLGLLIEGCTLMCTFTSGLLNGREFECAWRESSAEIGLIPIDENDVQIPSGVYKPNVGDTFILWNLAMPQSSITIAQKELCVEAINYIEELATSITETDCTTEAEATRISGLNTKIKVGQRISVNSNVFRNGRLSSRIIKYSYKLTTPYDVNFTLASSRQTGRLATLENMIADVTHEVHAVNQVQQAISRRQWHDTEEMMSMLDSIQKQMVVVGDENNAFGTTCSLKYNSDTKQLLVSEGYVLHQSFTDNDFNGQWNIDSFTRDMSAIDPDGKTPFYVFFVCPKSKETAEKGYTDVASALPTYDDYYVFILGILSSEFEGKRAFNQTNGITSIAGGNVTTNVIQDPGQRLIVDFANATITARNGATIKGAIQFEKGEGENDLGTALDDLLNGVQGAQDIADEANDKADKAQNAIDNLEIGAVNMLPNSLPKELGEWEGKNATVTFIDNSLKGVSSSSYAYIFNEYFSGKTFDVGEYYTISFMAKYSRTDNTTPSGNRDIYIGDYNEASVIIDFGEINPATSWTKYALTAKCLMASATTSSTSNKVGLYIRCGSSYSNYSDILEIKEIKIEKGTIATDWSPAPEEIEAELADTMNAIETLNDDSIFQQSEKLTIRKEWEEISGTAVTPSDTADVTIPATYGDSGSYKKTLALIPTDSGISTTNIDSKIDTLRSYLNTYKLYRNNKKFLRLGETDPAVVSDFNRSTLAQHFQAYYNEEANLIKAINDHFAEKQVKDLEIGRVNLVTDSRTSNWYKWSGNATGSLSKEFEYSRVTYSSNGYLQIYTNQLSNFTTKKIAGNITISLKFKVSVKQNRRLQFSVRYNNTDLFVTANSYVDYEPNVWHTIKHTFKMPHNLDDTINGYVPNYVYVVLNSTTTCASGTTIDIKELNIERGTTATIWQPDIIEARENILKDAMLVKAVSTGGTGSKELILNKGLKPNTEYVVSIENIIVNNDPNNSANISFTIWNNAGTTLIQEVQIPITSNKTKNTLTFSTQSNVSSTDRIWIYPGVRGSSVNGDFTFVGVKFAEGNKYTGWEGTPDEQQALITLNNAMKGSTDIIGGLVMTNLIGMKGYGTEASQIKAGISGLNENNNLRFWAGSTAWSNANTAPFRVYDNGDVYGGSFYGLNNAFEINASNIFDVCDCDYTSLSTPLFTFKLELIGDYIYISNIGTITLPNGTSTSAIQFQIPQLPKHMGTTIRIYNPNKYVLLRYTETLLPYSQCNTLNYLNTTIKTSITSFKDGIIASGSGDSAYYYNWSIVRGIAYTFRPNYCEIIALPISVPANTRVPAELIKYKKSGSASLSTNGSYYTNNTCVFMKWILTQNFN